jgi:hypothetical protein
MRTPTVVGHAGSSSRGVGYARVCGAGPYWLRERPTYYPAPSHVWQAIEKLGRLEEGNVAEAFQQLASKVRFPFLGWVALPRARATGCLGHGSSSSSWIYISF